MPVLMPAVFVGHGSPMNAIQQNEFTESLKKVGRTLPTPKQIVVISAHWLTQGTHLTDGAEPKQIYDFAGFPSSLSRLRYTPPGSSALALRISKLSTAGQISLDSTWGLDHGAWSILHHMFPEADVPVVQISLNSEATESEHFALGRLLAPLRTEGVLIIGSGNIVHNLGDISMDQYPQTYDWARTCDLAVKSCLDSQDDDLLKKYGGLDKSLVRRMAPSNDHYLPLLYIAALRNKAEPVTYFHQGFQHGSISMRSFIVGK